MSSHTFEDELALVNQSFKDMDTYVEQVGQAFEKISSEDHIPGEPPTMNTKDALQPFQNVFNKIGRGKRSAAETSFRWQSRRAEQRIHALYDELKDTSERLMPLEEWVDKTIGDREGVDMDVKAFEKEITGMPTDPISHQVLPKATCFRTGTDKSILPDLIRFFNLLLGYITIGPSKEDRWIIL